MGTEYAWIPAVIGIATSVAGTGISMYAQNEQAQNAERMAQYNYAVQQQNAEISAKMAVQNAKWAQQQAQAQAQAQVNNATSMVDQARLVEAQGREEARRMREENERTKAMQRARYARSGVTSEGTPLAVMAETAGLMELGVKDAAFVIEMEARAWDRKAENERYQAGFSLFDAQIAKYEEAAAKTGYALQMNQAKVNRLAGQSEAQGYRLASYGTLLTGFSNAASSSQSLFGPSTRTAAGKKFNPYAEVRRAIPVA